MSFKYLVVQYLEGAIQIVYIMITIICLKMLYHSSEWLDDVYHGFPGFLDVKNELRWLVARPTCRTNLNLKRRLFCRALTEMC